MSNEDKHIDQLFRDKLSSAEFDIPDAFLDDLNTRLDMLPTTKNKSKKVFFFWLGGIIGIALLIIGSIIWFVPSNSTSHVATTQVSTNSENLNQTQNQTIQNTSKEEVQSTPPIHNTLTNEKSSADKNNETEETKKLEKTQTVAQKQNYSSIESTTTKSPLKNNRDTKQTNTIKSTKTKENATKEHKNSSVSTTNNEHTDKNTIKETKNNNISNKETKAEAEAQQQKETALISDTSKPSEDTIKKIRYIDSVVVRDSVVIIYDTIKAIDSSAIQQKQKRNKKENKNKTSNNGLRIETQGLFGIYNTKAVQSPKPLLPIEQTFISHNIITTTDVGAEVNIYKNNIYLTSGIKYMCWGDKYTYSINNYKLRDTVEFVGYDTTIYIDTFNQIDTIITPIYDSITITDTLILKNTQQRKYNRLVIPLKLGYTFNFGLWNIIPKAGINVEINISNKNTTAFQKPARLSRMGVSYVLQMDVKRKFGDKYIYVSPVYRQTLTPLIKTDASYHVFKAIGVQFGIGFSL